MGRGYSLPAFYHQSKVMKKVIFFLLPLLLIINGCSEKPLDLRQAQRDCSVKQGFDYFSPGQARIGYLTYLKVNGIECPADFNLADPVNPQVKINVAGVLSWLAWDETKKGRIVFASRVSSTNKDKLLEMSKTIQPGAGVELAFTMYSFDGNTAGYFPSLSSNSYILTGSIDTSNGHIMYYQSGDAEMDVTNPVNFNFQLGIEPSESTQKILLSSAPGKHSYKNWGGK